MKNSVHANGEKKQIKLEIVSDYICPWCYIGRKLLDNAIPNLPGDIDVEITYLPFELNTDMPKEGINRKEYRTRKFGSWEKSKEMDERVTDAGKRIGLNFRYNLVDITPNTLNAHLLTHYAQSLNKHREISKAIFKAYFEDGLNIGDQNILIEIGGENGIDAGEVKEALNSPDAVKTIKDLENHNRDRGINSVPFLIADRSLGLSGAQPEDVLIEFLTKGNR